MARSGFLGRVGARLILVVGVLTLSGGATAAPAADSAEAAFERYRTKINLHDFDALAEDVIATDARFFFAGEAHRGIEAARQAFDRTWSIIPDEVYEMDEVEWLTLGSDNALVSFRYRYRGTLKDGGAISGGGHGTNLYTRLPEGWRLTYEHLSHDPASKAGQQ